MLGSHRYAPKDAELQLANIGNEKEFDAIWPTDHSQKPSTELRKLIDGLPTKITSVAQSEFKRKLGSSTIGGLIGGSTIGGLIGGFGGHEMGLPYKVPAAI